MKKQLGFLLVMLVMLLTVSAALADNVRKSGLYTYEIKGNGTITITKFDWKNSTSGDIFIPNMIDGYNVTGIGDRAFYNDNPTSWDMPPEVNITLGEGIKSIGAEAFAHCSLASINIPNSVQSIGYGAFIRSNYWTYDRLQFKIQPSHPYFAVIDGCLYNKSTKELIKGNNISDDDNDLIIPEGIVSIGDYAFASCKIDRQISFPSTLTKIGDHAFEDSVIYAGQYVNTRMFNLPKSLERIGDYAFNNALIYRFAEDNLPLSQTSISYIGDYAFANARYMRCNDDDCFTLPSTLEYLGKHAFENVHYGDSYSWQKFTLTIKLPQESKLKSISDFAFNDFDGVVLLENTSAIDHIGEYSGCGSSFTDVTDFSPNLTTIPSGMNPAVNELPDTVTEISSKAFTATVEDFKLPSSISKIALDAFPRYSTFIVDAGSYAELWCSENGIAYTVEGGNNLDWLNN